MIDSPYKTLISSEGKARLLIETTKSMQAVTGLVDQARRSITFMDQVNAVNPDLSKKNLGNQTPDDQHHLRRLVEHTLVVGLIQLDLTAGIRTYLADTEPYDTV